MIVVKFNVPDEFLGELAKDAGHVGRGIVRCTTVSIPSRVSPNIRLVSVVAGAVVNDSLVKLETFVGDRWGIPESDKATTDKAQKLMAEIEKRCSELGLHVRAGTFETAEE